jgi:sugar lactone lactonase YvrE
VDQAEQITPPVAHHGEGPVWWVGWGGLRWVDMLAGDVLSLAPDGQVSRRHVDRVVAAMRPRAAGGSVFAVERGFALDAGDGSPLRHLGELWSGADVRFNDGSCDPHGRFYCGSMAYDEAAGRGALYCLEPDHTTRLMFSGVTVSNGLEWAPDGSRAYYVDSPTQRIDVFDYDAGSGLTNRRTLVEIPTASGAPDGLTVDAEGGIWVALWGGRAVHRYGPDGRLDAVVPVPVSHVTACTFGGSQLDELFITTSRSGLGPADEPRAGALFRVAPGIRGLPARTYGG